MPENQDEFIPTRRSLLTRLKDWDDQESWKDFFNTYWKLIYGVAVKSGLSDPEAQDVVQETVVSVAKKMHEFKYDPAAGSFKNWLLLITRRRITDHLRKEYRQVDVAEPRPKEGPETSTIERFADPALPALDQMWEAEWEKNLMDAAMQRVKRQVKSKQWQIFDFYVLKKWPVTKVTRSLGVSITQVYLAKHRVARLIKKEIETLEKRMI
ncbi:MAG: sigma-70 family RNA polymerase sigma factor [Verrucomicrobia bacterium]|nr:sigma-70 family RNA polymerase sigma factor [Verrucomicrobiota bacterium]